MLARRCDVAIRHRTEHDLHAERWTGPHGRVERELTRFSADLAVDEYLPQKPGRIVRRTQLDDGGGKCGARRAFGETLGVPGIVCRRGGAGEVDRLTVAHHEEGDANGLVGE